VQAGTPVSRSPRFAGLLRNTSILRAVVFCAVAVVLTVAWIPFAPARLFDFDAVNFALALDYFQPAAHQPQPPGYPLYVALTKAIHLFVDDVAFAFLIAGLLGATVAVVLLWILGEQMFGRRTGVLAALLFMTNPILWQTGMSDQVRIYIAVISIAIALSVWPGWEGNYTWRRFAWSGFLLGFLAGFRPEMLVSMAPLPFIAAMRSRMKLQHYVLSAVALAVGMAPWFVVLLVRVGGVSGFIAMMQVYSAEQAASHMFSSAFWWASLGVAAWCPAIVLVRWGRVAGGQKGQSYFLLIWFLSLFLFSVVVHIAASGHSLGFIPVLCLAGGWILSEVGATRNRLLMVLCLLAALSLNVVFFFKPYASEVREASYPHVAGIGDVAEAALEKVDRITQQNHAFLVSDDAWVSWRILQYYYPKTPLIYMPGPMAPADTNLPVWLIENHLRVRDLDPRVPLPLPACGTIIWLVTDYRSRQQLLTIPGADDEHYFIAIPAHPDMQFTVGRYHLASSHEPCKPQH
jgi:hypothetical protein